MAKADAPSASSEQNKVKVRFNSPLSRHNRVISAADFKRAGVEHGKIDVAAGEVVEVPAEVAKLLVDDLGEFTRVGDDAESEPAGEQLTDSSLNQQLQDQNPDVGAGQSSTGANTRDGAGARSATINR